jgi:hypothetical protein
MHLAPVIKAMKAVRRASSKALIVNAAFPDAIHPALHEAGLSPDVGIGNVANNIPALQTIAADRLGCDVSEVRVKFIAHHYVSHRMRYGDTGSARACLRVFRAGEDVSSMLPLELLLQSLAGEYRRTPGVPGQAMVAASALSVIEPLADGAESLGHAPGPCGLPGGYPIRMADGRVSLDLPADILLEDAIAINVDGQVHDGITRIADGYIDFEESSMDIMYSHLRYECKRMHWSEAEARAEELGERFALYRARVGSAL